MDLLELDERLEKDIKHLEKSLIEYERLMNEASHLKYIFENQTKELMKAYGNKIEQLNEQFIKDRELATKSVKSFNDYYNDIVPLLNDIELKKNLFELYITQMDESYDEKWKDIQVQNENNLAKLDEKVNDKINKLEEENKQELMKIINALTVNEKEIVHSKKEVTEFISDEVYKLLGKKNVIDKSIESINTDISQIKSESERSLIDFSSELFKETMRADEKYRELDKRFKIFMAISSVLFIILLIWR